MEPMTPENTSHTEGDLRLHAAIRAVISPGVWFVLLVQITLMFALQWRVPEETEPTLSLMVLFLTALMLMGFFYLQAGALQALSEGRSVLTVSEVLRAGHFVFGPFIWLTLKAGLLFAVVVNVVLLLVLVTTGLGFEALVEKMSVLFGPLMGLMAFVFVYWLPHVFVHRDFRLLETLKAGLLHFWNRLSQSVFLVVLVLVPSWVSALLPAKGPLWVDALASAATGLLGWVAYIYCTDILKQHLPPVVESTSS